MVVLGSLSVSQSFLTVPPDPLNGLILRLIATWLHEFTHMLDLAENFVPNSCTNTKVVRSLQPKTGPQLSPQGLQLFPSPQKEPCLAWYFYRLNTSYPMLPSGLCSWFQTYLDVSGGYSTYGLRLKSTWITLLNTKVAKGIWGAFHRISCY